jgi:hypothetical protein
MIIIDGHEIDYPDDNLSRRFRQWLPEHREVEQDFVAEATFALRRRSTISGYVIFGNLRWKYKYKLGNDFAPMMARVAVAKHPELASVFTFKKTGWGQRRKRNPEDEDAADLPLFDDKDEKQA